jgi:hypothetical protein
MGLGLFLAGGISAALLAARLLPAEQYTVYAAYSSLIGILVLGPAGSLEQESTLRFSHGHRSGRSALIAMLVRGLGLAVVIAVVVLMPIGEWQQRLLGTSTGLASTCIVFGAPVVLAAAVGRGSLTAREHLRPVGAANAATGAAMLALPVLLHGLGIGWLSAFIVGALLAWGPAVLIVWWRARRVTAPLSVSAGVQAPLQHRITVWLLAGNLLMLTTLLAVPVVLRWHVADLGADKVANAQLLVSVSRLSTTVILGFLPLMVAQFSAPHRWAHPVRRWFGTAICLGLATVVIFTLMGGPLISWLGGSRSQLSWKENLLATLPTLTLCPALVAMSLAIVRRRWGLIIAGWGAALSVLVLTLGIDPQNNLARVLSLIAVACLLPLAMLAGGMFRLSTTRHAPTI